jgi:ribonuclease PH
VLAMASMRDKGALQHLPITDYVAATSVGVVDGARLLDLAYEEDSKAEVDMNVVMTGAGKYIEVQGTAEALPFGRDALMEMLDLGQRGIGNLIELQKKAVGHLLK